MLPCQPHDSAPSPRLIPVAFEGGEPHRDFVACIAQHTRDRAYGGGSFIAEVAVDETTIEKVEGYDGDDARLWVCAYANRQWSLASDVTDDPSQTSFHRAMRLALKSKE